MILYRIIDYVKLASMSENDKNTSKPSLHRGAAHASPYPLSRLSANFDLVDIAREIEQADHMINTTSHAKLRLIADQMLRLKEQARTILQDTRQNQALHRADCQFRKIPGKTYHLYRRKNAGLYFSMLSPDDWKQQPTDKFEGSYTLQADMSWKAVDDTEDEMKDLNRLLDSL